MHGQIEALKVHAPEKFNFECISHVEDSEEGEISPLLFKNPMC